MKKLLYIIPCLMLMMTSCELFELDNLDGPNAQISGKFIDSGTGETVQMEHYTGNVTGILEVVELGWDFEEIQNWLVKYDGSYRNDRVFAGDYRIQSPKLNCYPFSDTITISEGNNVQDFEVTPFCRIVDPVITYNSTTQMIEATFQVSMGDATKIGSVSQLKFVASTDMFVGNYFNLIASSDAGARKTTPTLPGVPVTLRINTALPANSNQFMYVRDHYVRIAALAQGGGNNTKGFFNFSPVFKISSDFSTITQVTFE